MIKADVVVAFNAETKKVGMFILKFVDEYGEPWSWQLAGDEMILRSETDLYCIAAGHETAPKPPEPKRSAANSAGGKGC